MISQFVTSGVFFPTFPLFKLQLPCSIRYLLTILNFWKHLLLILITLQPSDQSAHLSDHCLHIYFGGCPFTANLKFLILAFSFCLVMSSIQGFNNQSYANNFSSFIRSLSPFQCPEPAFYLQAEHIIVQGVKPTTASLIPSKVMNHQVLQLLLNIQSLGPCH